MRAEQPPLLVGLQERPRLSQGFSGSEGTRRQRIEYRTSEQQRFREANPVGALPQDNNGPFALDDSRRGAGRYADEVTVPHLGGGVQLSTMLPSAPDARASQRAPSAKSLLTNHNHAIPETIDSAASMSPVSRSNRPRPSYWPTPG